MPPSPELPARKTRREQQAETRAAVVEAARRVFLERGYDGATLADVVAAAGFTKGAVYSNFSGKAELGLAVLAEIENENVLNLGRMLNGVEDPAARARVLTQWAETLLEDVATIRLRGAVNAVALDDPVLAEQLTAKSRSGRAVLVEVLRQMATADRFLLDVELLASALIALSNGVGMQRLIDPEFDLRAFVWAAGALTGYPVPRTDPSTESPS